MVPHKSANASMKYIDCHEELTLNWFIADALFSFVIPFSLITVFNILIVNLIRKHAQSPMTVQSTWRQLNQRDRTSRNHQKRRINNNHNESDSLTNNNNTSLCFYK